MLALLLQTSMQTLISQRTSSLSLGDCDLNGLLVFDQNLGNEVPLLALGSAYVDGCSKNIAC
jgi:hypothetical protein